MNYSWVGAASKNSANFFSAPNGTLLPFMYLVDADGQNGYLYIGPGHDLTDVYARFDATSNRNVFGWCQVEVPRMPGQDRALHFGPVVKTQVGFADRLLDFMSTKDVRLDMPASATLVGAVSGLPPLEDRAGLKTPAQPVDTKMPADSRPWTESSYDPVRDFEAMPRQPLE